MQIDLQPPLAITKITHGDSQLKFDREGNVDWVMFEEDIPKGAEDKIEIFYEGVPVVSRNPPEWLCTKSPSPVRVSGRLKTSPAIHRWDHAGIRHQVREADD
jgi:hypothetical protein